MTKRPIKFRAWDKELGMVYEPGFFIPKAGQFSLNAVFADTKTIFDSPSPVFMQFTGLHDKNGKEIWEGDVVRYGVHGNDAKPLTLAVEWERDTCSFNMAMLGMLSRLTFNSNPLEAIEVIGNIYENPELVETKPQQPAH